MSGSASTVAFDRRSRAGGAIDAAVEVGRVPWRAWGVATVVGALTWSPVIVDLATRRTGNLRALVRYFRSGTPQPAGFREGVAIVAGEASPWPTWLTGPRPQGLFLEARQAGGGWWLAAAVVLIVAAGRTRHRGVIVGISGFVAATAAASQLRGSRFHYLVYWRAPVLLFAALVVGHAWMTRRSRDPRTSADATSMLAEQHGRVGVFRSAGSPDERFGAAVGNHRLVAERFAVACIGVISVALATWSAARADQVTRYAGVLADIASQARQASSGDGRVLLRLGDGGVVGLLPGVLHDLDIRGADVGVDAALEWVVGDRSIDPASADEVWYVTDNGWSFETLSRLPGARVIASHDVAPSSKGAPGEFGEVAVQLVGQLREAGRVDLVRALDSPLVALALADVPAVDPALVERLAQLNIGARPGDRVGIVAFPPDVAPVIDWPLNAL